MLVKFIQTTFRPSNSRTDVRVNSNFRHLHDNLDVSTHPRSLCHSFLGEGRSYPRLHSTPRTVLEPEQALTAESRHQSPGLMVGPASCRVTPESLAEMQTLQECAHLPDHRLPGEDSRPRRGSAARPSPGPAHRARGRRAGTTGPQKLPEPGRGPRL